MDRAKCPSHHHEKHEKPASQPAHNDMHLCGPKCINVFFIRKSRALNHKAHTVYVFVRVVISCGLRITCCRKLSAIYLLILSYRIYGRRRDHDDDRDGNNGVIETTHGNIDTVFLFCWFRVSFNRMDELDWEHRKLDNECDAGKQGNSWCASHLLADRMRVGLVDSVLCIECLCSIFLDFCLAVYVWLMLTM